MLTFLHNYMICVHLYPLCIITEEGASKDPCSDTYCGPKAFSEVEVKGVADFLSKIENLKGFIDFHSYSQLWMSPWGYTKEKPEDFKLQVRLKTIIQLLVQMGFSGLEGDC